MIKQKKNVFVLQAKILYTSQLHAIEKNISVRQLNIADSKKKYKKDMSI